MKTKSYFKVLRSGYDPDAQREEVVINAGQFGSVVVYKTDEGIVVDIFNQDECVASTYAFDGELNSVEE